MSQAAQAGPGLISARIRQSLAEHGENAIRAAYGAAEASIDDILRGGSRPPRRQRLKSDYDVLAAIRCTGYAVRLAGAGHSRGRGSRNSRQRLHGADLPKGRVRKLFQATVLKV
jgi:hypothetical protein